LSAYFESKGFPSVRFGGIIIEEIERRGLPVTAANERLVREDIRALHGMDACAKLALPLIKSKLNGNRLVVIDGLYSLSEYKTLKSTFGDEMVVLAVFAPKNLRYQRLAVREERPLTLEESKERDLLEVEKIEKAGPIALADYTLINDGTTIELIQKSEQLLDSLLKENN
jgi:dephospho-CoA kinase